MFQRPSPRQQVIERAQPPFVSVRRLHTGINLCKLTDLGLIWFSIAYYLMLRKLLFMTFTPLHTGEVSIIDFLSGDGCPVVLTAVFLH